MSDAEVEHFCPGCGQPQRLFARYPWYFCQACLTQAVDGDGRRLGFTNASISGGLAWHYADDPSMTDALALSVRCLIRGRPVTVSEARFGGVVAEPVGSETQHLPVHDDNRVVLTVGPALAAARARLRQPGSRR